MSAADRPCWYHVSAEARLRHVAGGLGLWEVAGGAARLKGVSADVGARARPTSAVVTACCSAVVVVVEGDLVLLQDGGI